MKSVLRSIKPYWLYLILTKNKTVEVVKNCPLSKEWDGIVELYCSKDMNSFSCIPTRDREWMIKYVGKVSCCFICDKVYEYTYDYCDGVDIDNDMILETAIDREDINIYAKGKTLYGLHISDLKIYDTPKTLAEFYKYGAESFEKLFDVNGLCSYCSETDYGKHKYDISSRWGMVPCEGRWCDEAYQQYLDENFAITRAPSNWCYVEDLGEAK